MFDPKEYYSQYNEKLKTSYNKTIPVIKNIMDETEDYNIAGEKKEFHRFFYSIASNIIKMVDYEKKVNADYFYSHTFEELLKENHSFYNEIIPANYPHSYSNPAYSVKIFGNNYGQLFAFFYGKYRRYIDYAFFHKIFRMEEYNRSFIDVFNYISNNEKLDYEELKQIITGPDREDKTEMLILNYKESFDKDYKYFTDIIETSDLDDLRYLLRYNHFITDNEMKTADFMADYPQEKIDKLCKQISSCYVNGFIRDGKDRTNKTTVNIVYSIGQEKIIYNLIKHLKEYGFDCLINSVSSTPANRQYSYDHRFDAALFIDENYTALHEKNLADALEQCKDILSVYSGSVCIDKFGEHPFLPQHKDECLKFSQEQQKFFHSHQNNVTALQDKYMSRKNWSFTIMALPSPEILENFEQIFEDILEVNMLESEKYEIIQQKIIDVLDKASYVHIKGKGKNQTNMKVKLQELRHPDKETIFFNCGADVNIPVGEIFTSPQLKGTTGVLHLEETYLDDLKYIDLKLVFKDGYVVDYSCNNHDKEEDNKKYIEENLFFPHKTLPLGEFAIGTNTLAYLVARKYDIMHLLPVLIIEKIGPHFAIGDTCFLWEEDRAVYNNDSKEIIARDNEKSILRKTNINDAYTHKHTDITLPYESIEYISAVAKHGKKVDIISNGRFVLPGTEELNEPLLHLMN